MRKTRTIYKLQYTTWFNKIRSLCFLGWPGRTAWTIIFFQLGPFSERALFPIYF